MAELRNKKRKTGAYKPGLWKHTKSRAGQGTVKISNTSRTEKSAYIIIGSVGVLVLIVFAAMQLFKGPNPEQRAAAKYSKAEELYKQGQPYLAIELFDKIDPLVPEWHEKAIARVKEIKHEGRQVREQSAREEFEEIENFAREHPEDLKGLRRRYRVFRENFKDTLHESLARNRIMVIDKKLAEQNPEE